jgi:anti-anti-sigma factor
MRPQSLEASVYHQAGMSIIELHGELDASSDLVLRAAYTEAATHNTSHTILINFRGVRYMQRVGIALLVALWTQAQTTQQQLMLCDLSEYEEELFTITRLSDLMPIFPDEAHALAAQTSQQ